MSADQAPWRRQSSQISANGASSPSPGPPPGAPPPPPPYAVGAIPSSRIPTEMSCRKEPPAAIQNAMMTKDKKPFTYTPGGLDLAEIRSPRMAKRLSRNAHLEDRYDQNDSSQMYQQHMPMMQQQVPMFQQQIPMMQQQVPMMQQQVPMMQQQVPMMQQQVPMMQQQQVPSMQRPQTPGQQMPPMGHPMMMVPQSPRGWSQANSSPVQSRSFRVLQKITGSDQEEPAYREMMSPPVYTVPAHPPQFYMRSPTYDNNAQQQEGGGSGNYWVWDANSQTYVPNNRPSNTPCVTPSPAPCSANGWQWDGESGHQNQVQEGAYPSQYDYWNYPPQNEEEQRQFWEHYGQMCAYLAQLNAAACRYSPYPCQPMPYPSDSEECGYSSNDEMTYYGQMFKQRAQNNWQNCRPQPAPDSTRSTPKANVSDEPVEGKDEDSDSTDTETDNVEKPDGNNNITDGSDPSDDESSHSGTEIPHQLSVIYEEAELQSEADGSRISFQQSDDEDSSATLGNDSRKASADNTSSDTESSIVRVRLPLKLKFSSTDCPVTTVIVGDSEVESSPDVRSEDVWSPIPDRIGNSPSRNSSWNISPPEEKESSPLPDVTVTINLNKKKKPLPVVEVNSKIEVKEEPKGPAVVIEDSLEDEVDFWKEIGSADDLKKNDKKNNDGNLISGFIEPSSQKKEAFETNVTSDEESESESSSDEEAEIKRVDIHIHASEPMGKTTSTVEKNNSSETDSDSDSDSSEENLEASESSTNPAKCGSVRRNMDLLMFKTSIDNDKSREGDESDNDDSSDSDSSCANLSLGLDGQNDDRTDERLNERLVEESEEDDSGVTSDLSRHISETDTDAEGGSELSKMTRYQRAATHSRLFKLLQDECNGQDEDDGMVTVTKRERLTLPLVGNASKSNISSDQESSSSGINSPMSPAVNERLVKELVQSLLSRKKGRHFRKLPLEKLYTAAARILQEDMDYDTGSTSDDSNMFLSPCDNSRLEQPPGFQLPNPEHYGDNYYDYCDYYSSWADAEYYSSQPTFDILPSKTFRTLRDTTEKERNRNDFSYPVRCPKLPLPKLITSEPKPDTAPPET